MKYSLLKPLLMAVALAMASVGQSNAAAFLRIKALTEANGPITQMDIISNAFGSNATVGAGSWNSTGFGYEFDAVNETQTALQIYGGTDFSFTIDSSGPSGPQTTPFGGLTFQNDPNSPSVIAYDVNGNPINSLIGQSVGVNLTSYGVYKIRVGGPQILAGYAGGAYNVNLLGDVQTGTLTVGLVTSEGNTGPGSATGTLTVVPEPGSAGLVVLTCLGMMCRRSRRR